MKRNNFKHYITIFLVIIGALMLCGDNHNKTNIEESFSRGNKKEIAKIQKAIIEERKNTIESLIKVLKNNKMQKMHYVYFKTIYLLGELRAKEATSILLDNICYNRDMFFINSQPPVTNEGDIGSLVV